MIELVICTLLIGCLTGLIYLMATGMSDWWAQRRQARIKRVQREIAQTQQQLQDLAFRHDAWLRDQAHEARKALIMESFRAAQEASTDVHEDPRCTKYNKVWRHS